MSDVVQTTDTTANNSPPAVTADMSTPVKPADTKPEAPAEKPFNLDLLQSCTARMTHQCWQTYLSMKSDLGLMQTQPVRVTLISRSDKGLDELLPLLKDNGVTQHTRRDAKTIDMTATFAQLQTVIKHPQTYLVDAIKLHA